MVTNRTSRTNSRRSSSSSNAKNTDRPPQESDPAEVNSNDVTESSDLSDPPKEESTMSTEVIDVTSEAADSPEGAIQLHSQPSLSIWNRPIMSSEMEVVGTIQSAGIRPIAASPMAIYGTLMGGRPIEANGLRVADMVGDSPIFYSEVQMIEGESGIFGRPIMVSDPALMNSEAGYGGRPIASNAIDDARSLMGFID
ncbi:MAG: hypothetical protein HC780_17080 [Leptolyngbyaceae cyanobacterium CSU_1_3]|nr:hypothetical protein [Leptolyngbyaceae cyanobacterium CSU_1_3]